ncbi:Hypothetical predicted protein [Cloeon dipterum]|uniref:Uncharacterized protein n=1 Tax=Cloeon dipterum TaxID=197152 RepID=A0A8S1BTY3_9INSE|nr:Hypothetical predicted protein [Cloeon dipterum]
MHAIFLFLHSVPGSPTGQQLVRLTPFDSAGRNIALLANCLCICIFGGVCVVVPSDHARLESDAGFTHTIMSTKFIAGLTTNLCKASINCA